MKRSDRYLKGNCALAEGVCVCVRVVERGLLGVSHGADASKGQSQVSWLTEPQVQTSKTTKSERTT